GGDGLAEGIDALAGHTRELQEAVMSIRAQPVKLVFARMNRLVHDVSGQLGKSIKLVLSGEDTEVDKAVVEQLADPLTHMMRNAMDHGLEPPDERERAGKPRQGLIHLSASQRGGRIIIQVADDGRGIDRARVRQKAEERGLIAPDAELSDAEIDNLIFAPGFSTAEALSDISGRGVGMDVVRRNVQTLGGRIGIESEPGQGSRFTLSLPLTLAVLDGMIIGVGGETYVLPVTSIVETFLPAPDDVERLVGRSDLVRIRDEYLPLIHLGRLFGVDGARANPADGLVVVAEVDGGRRVGLVIDEMLGQQQVVVKSLERNFRSVDGLSGATILGDGRVALIVDAANVDALWRDGGEPAAPVAALPPAKETAR
ncbi:MAG: chemotaxis protein CheA, partial [Pseudomonadota bacterium]